MTLVAFGGSAFPDSQETPWLYVNHRFGLPQKVCCPPKVNRTLQTITNRTEAPDPQAAKFAQISRKLKYIADKLRQRHAPSRGGVGGKSAPSASKSRARSRRKAAVPAPVTKITPFSSVTNESLTR